VILRSLHVRFGSKYGEPMAQDATFQRAQRLVALDFSGKGAEIMANNPAVMRFMGRDSGILVLLKLIQMQMSAGNGEKGLSYSDIGVRFGISRTHVRALLEDAAQHNDVSLSGRGGRLVALQPVHPASVRPHFLADAMSGHDLLYKFARERMTKEVRRPNF
jgi:hypothetical protein